MRVYLTLGGKQTKTFRLAESSQRVLYVDFSYFFILNLNLYFIPHAGVRQRHATPLLRLVPTIELKLGWPRAHGASAEPGGREECGWLEGPTQNPTLKLRTYQSYEHTHTHTHTHIQNVNTRLYPGLRFLHICLPSCYSYSFFFLLHAWLNETPITFWTLGRICGTTAITVTNMSDCRLDDEWV